MILSLHPNMNNKNTSLYQNNIDYSYSNSSQRKKNNKIQWINCLSKKSYEKKVIIKIHH